MDVRLFLLLVVKMVVASKVGLGTELEAESAEVTSAGLGLLQRQLDVSRNTEQTENCEQLAKQAAVFIVSAGRSGSTSILHMLNQIPGYDLHGHNGNVLSSLFEMYSTRDKDYKTYPGMSYYAWTRSSQRNTTMRLCSLQTLLHGELNPSPDARVIGFKETDWGFEKHLLDLDLLMQAFPNAKVIFSTRNSLEKQLESMRKAWGRSMYKELTEANKVMKKFSQSHAGRTYTLALEDFSVDNFNKLLVFLGEDNCEFKSVVHDNKGTTMTATDEVSYDYITCHAKSPREKRTPTSK